MQVEEATKRDTLGLAAIVCGVLGFAAVNLMYWMVVPGFVLGLAAALLGWKVLRQGRRELAAVAITMGVLTMILVPSFLQVASSNEDWGRDCALHPEHDPNC